MGDMLASLPNPPKEGDLMEGAIVSFLSAGAYAIDLSAIRHRYHLWTRISKRARCAQNANVVDKDYREKVVDAENENGCTLNSSKKRAAGAHLE